MWKRRDRVGAAEGLLPVKTLQYFLWQVCCRYTDSLKGVIDEGQSTDGIRNYEHSAIEVEQTPHIASYRIEKERRIIRLWNKYDSSQSCQSASV